MKIGFSIYDTCSNLVQVDVDIETARLIRKLAIEEVERIYTDDSDGLEFEKADDLLYRIQMLNSAIRQAKAAEAKEEEEK